MYTYLLINVFTILFPALFSFEPRVCYIKKWKYVFFSTLIVAVLFVAWDAVFTARGVWGFNAKYLIGVSFFGLPLEEILFFFCIPFSCLFIYEIVRRFQKKDVFARVQEPMTYTLIALLLVLAVINWDKIYTAVNFSALALLLFWHLRIFRANYLGFFYSAYVVSLVPFLIVNGILTNGLKVIDAGPVVWYNPTAIIGVRIVGIPVEDFLYSMLLFLLNVGLYEHFQNREKERA